MNFLHTSDLHLGKMLENFSRLDEQEMFFDELVQICDDKNIDVILIAGDVYDVKNPKTLAEKLFYSSLKRLSNNGQRLIVIIAGNHDSHDRIMTLKPFAQENGIIIIGYPNTIIDVNKYDNFEVLESYEGCFKISFKNEILNFITLPYPSEQSLNMYFDDTKEIDLQKSFNTHIKDIIQEKTKIYNNNEINLFMAHIFLRGGLTSSSEQAISVGGSLHLTMDILPKCDYIALGHLHRNQQLFEEQFAYYSGSPIAYSFSEYNHKKYVNIIGINFENNIKNINITKHQLKTYIPLEIWQVDSIEEAILMCENNKDSNSYIELRIKTNEVLTKSIYTTLRSLKKNIVSITPYIEFEKNLDISTDINYNEKSLLDEFIDYYKEVYNSEPKDDLLSTFIQIGEKENEY